MPQRVYSCSAEDSQALKKLLEYDPYLDKSLNEEQLAKLKSDSDANTIFARQDYLLKDGISIGLDREKYYLYINANDEFLERGEQKLKEKVGSIARVEPELEAEIIAGIEGERSASERGIGSIFG